MVSALDSESGGPVDPWPRHCIVFLGKILYSDVMYMK